MKPAMTMTIVHAAAEARREEMLHEAARRRLAHSQAREIDGRSSPKRLLGRHPGRVER